jgi:regulator of cell morphogenesis and NO signaling
MIADQKQSICERSVGELVAEDYRRADVFKRYGIDFCCGGNRTVRDAGAEKGIDCDELAGALAEAEQASLPTATGAPAPDVRAWPPDFLAAYITNVHHRYVRDRIPRIRELTRTIARVHGSAHPETHDIVDLFDELSTELLAHTEREERQLFPYIEALAGTSREAATAPVPTAPQEAAWIEALEDEHDHAGGLLRALRKVTNDYQVPASACNTYRITYAELEAFEADLHRHVHLENNVLFPAAARMRAAAEL